MTYGMTNSSTVVRDAVDWWMSGATTVHMCLLVKLFEYSKITSHSANQTTQQNKPPLFLYLEHQAVCMILIKCLICSLILIETRLSGQTCAKHMLGCCLQ